MWSPSSIAQAGIFRELMWHFFGRFFDKESLSPQGEPEAGAIQMLGILAPPGGFVALTSPKKGAAPFGAAPLLSGHLLTSTGS